MTVITTSLRSLAAIATLFFSLSVFALPNLTPYQPTGWSDKIVVSTVTGTSTDSSPLTTADTLFVDWAVINNGTATAGSFSISLYVDGVLKQSWGSGSLPVNNYALVQDYSIGSLSAGTHTVSITADSGNAVAESDETDNSYTKTITVGGSSLPNLAPYQPAGWSDKIVVSTGTGTSTDSSPLMATNTLYVDWAVTNNGNSVATNFSTSLYVDGVLQTSWNTTTLNPSAYTSVSDYSIGSLSLGSHTVTITTDSGNSVVESSESDNTYTKNITISAPALPGLTIIPNFDSTITSDPQAATIEATIDAAIAVYQSNFSDPITVNITFQKISGGLGQSTGVYYQQLSYSSYRAALVAHATTADDATALAHLPAGPNNPVTGDPSVNLKLALARALGFSADPPPGQPDGTVGLNLAIMNLSGASTDPSKFSLFATVSHEIDEVLGFSSALNGLANGDPAPTGAVFPEDLFRYDQTGARSFTTDASAPSYFSLDGTTDLARYNQTQGGDFHDWYSFFGGQTLQVQDAYSPPGSSPVLGVELRVLDAIGFTRALPQASITDSAGAGGSISPTGTFIKNIGDSQLFTATPNAGYIVNQWLLDTVVVQTGGSNYTLSNIQSNHAVQVTFNSKTNQTITFGALTNKVYGDPSFAVSATASSGLPVSFSIFSGPATVSGNTVTITGAGAVTVRASQPGNANYNAATNVDQSFTVAKATQTISFGPLPNKALGEPAFAVAGTASSGLPVSFSILSGPATISAGTVTLTNTGTIVVRASQAGDANHNAATNVDQSLTVFPPPSLSLTPFGQTVIVSWTTNVAGFSLLSATNLAAVASWTPVVPSPVIVNSQYVVTNAASGAGKFYQLKK